MDPLGLVQNVRMTGRGAPGPWATPLPDAAFVGRAELLGELTAAATDAAQGTGCLVLLTGDAGMGKTSVVRALAAGMRDELEVTWGRCIADGGSPPFWPWRVFDEGPSDAAPEAGATEEWAAGAPRFERLSALRAQLVERARQAPLLHVIEDLQWADVASVLLLGHLGAEVAGAPLMVVGTLRTGEAVPPALEAALEEVRRSALVRELPPLREDEIATLIREVQIGADPELTALVRDRTGGNPLYVTELLRAVRTEGSRDRLLEVVAGTVPSRVSEVVTHRLGRLPEAVTDAVATASVLGTEGDAAALVAVGGSTLEEVVELLEQARAARLLDAAPPGRWQFRHDLVRDAVYRSLADADRSRRHAAVLEALAAAGAPPPVLAHHALAAQPLFDADRATALAARAGESAFAQHAYEEAVTWLERALAVAPDATPPRWRAELLVLCGEAHRHIGQVEAARQAFLRAAERTDDPGLLARAALGYADPGADLGIAYRTNDPRTGELLDRALVAQPAGDSLTIVLLEARLAAELYFSDDPGRARVLATSAVDRAHRLGDRRALGAAEAVAHDAFVVGQADLDAQLAGSEQLLVWAQETGSAAARLTAHRARAFDLLAAGDLPGMDAEVLAFRRIAEPLGTPGYLWWPSLWAAMRALLEGRHEAAEERAVAAHEVGQRPFPTLALVNLSFLLFFLRREQGRLAEMEQATRDFAASQADIPAIRVGLALLLAELGRDEEAGGLLTAIHEGSLEALHDRNWPASWFQLARAAALVGDRDLSATLLEDRHRPSERCVMVSLATVCLGAADLATAWLLHTTGDLDAADERYASATALSSRIGARSWMAQAQVDHARLLLDRDRDGDRGAAAQLVHLAADAAEAIGLPPVTTACEALRGRLDASSPAPSTSAPAREAVFRRAGAVWDLSFGGRSVQIPDARGLRDLAHLLSRPGHAVSVLELAGDPGAEASGVRGAPALDQRARREIRDRLQHLDEEEAAAEARGDGERAALVREERQLLAEAVAKDLGLGGRSRRIGDPIERIRKTVSTRIRRAITAVARAHPELGRHLDRSIDTGAWCAYRPSEPVHWRT